ncbi:MAG: hypothetical protein AVDCRST_MAG40-2503, partial [uncultured Gemmatimonadaceae bacterium]
EGLGRRDEEDRPAARVDLRRGAASHAPQGHPGRAGRRGRAAPVDEHVRGDGAAGPRDAPRRGDGGVAVRRPLRAGAGGLPRRRRRGRARRRLERGVELAAPRGPRPRPLAPHPRLGDRAGRERGAAARRLRAPHRPAPAHLELRL